MAKITLTRQQSREIDQIAIERFGFSGLVLMENAGRGVVDVLLSIDSTLSGSAGSSIAILCGKGNNAGDGFVIARHLEIRGIGARVFLIYSPEELQGDAAVNYRILQSTSVPIVDLSKVADVGKALTDEASFNAWLVDAMLGTGARGEPRAPIAAAIEWMNAQSARRLAVDVPSGLDCDLGLPASRTVRAEVTCTFVAEKQGFLQDSARDYLGNLHVVSIGIPPSIVGELE